MGELPYYLYHQAGVDFFIIFIIFIILVIKHGWTSFLPPHPHPYPQYHLYVLLINIITIFLIIAIPIMMMVVTRSVTKEGDSLRVVCHPGHKLNGASVIPCTGSHHHHPIQHHCH